MSLLRSTNRAPAMPVLNHSLREFATSRTLSLRARLRRPVFGQPDGHGAPTRQARAGRAAIAVIAALILILLASACGPAAPAATAAPVTLRLALLPILDALPMYVADQEGYFAAQGIKVSFIPVASAAERDQMIASGQADGMINDLIATTLYNRDQSQVQIVRFAQVATAAQPEYRILAAPGSKLSTPADLKGVDIAVSQASVIEYVTDRLLEADGLAPTDIHVIAVPKIPDRMSLLAGGKLQAATLPEPFSTLAIQSGSKVLLDDSIHPEYGNSVISFRTAFIQQHPQAVTAFLKALEQAVTDVNKDHTRWSDLMVKYNLLPKALAGKYPAPTYPAYSLPTEAQFKDVVDWALSKGLIDHAVSYQDSVNTSVYKGQ